MNILVLTAVGVGCAAAVAALTAFVCRSGEKVRQLEIRKEYEAQIARLSAELSGAKVQQEKMEQLHLLAMEQLRQEHRQQVQTMVSQMKAETEDILKRRSDELSQGNRTDMDSILKPLKESIQTMQKAMRDNEESHIRNTVAFSKQLEQAVMELARKTADIGQKADNLSDALTSRPKVQGCFGENFLDAMLASEGLVKGVHYSKESANVDRSRPDFVFHFKEGLEQKELIVDSKVSLTAFVDYVNAEDEDARQSALTSHVKSVRRHIDELAAKDYPKRTKNSFADYVVMFMPVAAALQVAQEQDPMLWRDAYSKGVLITTEQTIMPFLKIIQLTWKKFNHDTNLAEMTKAAEAMIERVGMFYDSYRQLGHKLKAVCAEYNDGVGKLKDGGYSITTSARQVMKIGAGRKGGKELLIPTEEEFLVKDE